MLNRVPSLLACSALLMATAAYAQSQPAAPAAGAPVITPIPSVVSQPKVFVPTTAPAPAPASVVSPVTVQAGPGSETLQKQSRQFVQTFAATSAAIDQVPRWHRPICISVAGLSPEQAARVSARIQEVALGVGMRALPPGCNANIEVVFTDQPQAFMDKVASSREEVLGYYHRHDKDKLKVMSRPVQAWYVTGTTASGANSSTLAFVGLTTSVGPANGIAGGPDGAFVNSAQALTAASAYGNVADDPDNHPPVGCADAPQFTHCLASELQNVLIVVDTTKLKPGQTLGPVDDYLSMLALAQTKTLDGCTVLPSVIDLMGQICAGRQAPDGLTPADAAYLTSLYTSNPESTKSLQMDEISNRMSGMLVHPR
jgi:hypothetical protein